MQPMGSKHRAHRGSGWRQFGHASIFGFCWLRNGNADAEPRTRFGSASDLLHLWHRT